MDILGNNGNTNNESNSAESSSIASEKLLRDLQEEIRNMQNTSQPSATEEAILDLMRQMSRDLSDLAKASQSGAKDSIFTRRNEENRSKSPFDRRNSRKNKSGQKDGNTNDTGYKPGSFKEGVQEALMESLFGSNFRNDMRNVISNIAAQAGIEVEDLPGQFGKEFGKSILDPFKSSNTGDLISKKLHEIRNNSIKKANARVDFDLEEYMKDPNAAKRKQREVENAEHAGSAIDDTLSNVRDKLESGFNFVNGTINISGNALLNLNAPNVQNKTEDVSTEKADEQEAGVSDSDILTAAAVSIPNLRPDDIVALGSLPSEILSALPLDTLSKFFQDNENPDIQEFFKSSDFQDLVRTTTEKQSQASNRAEDQSLSTISLIVNGNAIIQANAVETPEKRSEATGTSLNAVVDRASREPEGPSKDMGEPDRTSAAGVRQESRQDIDFDNIKPGSPSTDAYNQAFADKFASAERVFEHAQENPISDVAADVVKDTAKDKVADKVVSTATSSNSSFVKDLFGSMGKDSTSLFGNIASKATSFFNPTTTAATAATAEAGTAALGGAAASAAGPLSQIATLLGTSMPQVVAVMAAVGIVMDLLQPVIEALGNFIGALTSAGNRVQETQEKATKEAQKRLEADVETMIEEPFNILKDAAQEVYDTWDSVLRKINGTQGYSEADLQDLMGAYAQRLRDEGLSSVVGATDITQNLTKVLDAGMSGQIAEEFAYLATILNAAIPTQDFFNYADTYTSVAASMIAQGYSQAEAIAYANSQLELFASDVLYASRNLAGGFTTGLQDASDLFADAVKISQSAKTNNASEIAGVLTSVSAIVGGIAPDLASGLVDNIVSAAVGGNSSQITALRSLAGVNASNTEFLQQLAKDPQSIFATLFENLANLQNMSNDNYMEVAEGLSEVFGISMDAFARVDFDYLADAISNMQVNTASLQENLAHLQSGETTLTKEQQRLAQANEYLMEEGLAYVLNNEAARAIQQHMWDEQLALEMQQATYGIEIVGTSQALLQSIVSFVSNILKILMPWYGAASTIEGIAQSSVESNALQKDIGKLLEAGKVGEGNKESYYQLTTRGVDLNLTPSLLELMGSNSSYYSANTIGNAAGGLINSVFTPVNTALNALKYKDAIANKIESLGPSSSSSSSFNSKARSDYSWGTVSKSAASFLSSGSISRGQALVSNPYLNGTSATEAAQSAVESKLAKALGSDYISNMVEESEGSLSYNEWIKQAEKDFGFSDIEKSLEDSGYALSDVRNLINSYNTQYGAEKEVARLSTEEEFWEKTLEFEESVLTKMDETYKLLDEKIYKTEDEFYKAWVDYFVNHTAYNNSYDSSSVEKIQREEKSGSEDAVYALAEALVKNTTDLSEPAIQTNALLSQILIVVNTIMNQNNKLGGGVSLPDTISAIAMGITNLNK